MPNRARVTWLASVVLPAALASNAFSQAPSSARLAGTVRDSSGVAVPLAQLTIHGVRGLTDSAGYFALAGLPAGSATLLIRRLGFEPLEITLELASARSDSVRLVLAAVPRELAEITTEAASRARVRLSDFNRHRQNGSGYYFERKEIEAQRAQRTSDILRRLPGVRILSDRSGRQLLRMGRSGGRDCPPDFWIDGVRAAFLNVDDIPLMDIEALEVYKGPSGLPPEYNSRLGSPACGSVVIWTRLPG